MANAAGPSRTLLVTVLDAKAGKPIRGATIRPHVNGVSIPEFQEPFETGPAGTARLPIPDNVPGGERADFCQFEVTAPGYVERVMRWYSTTGMVLNVVASKHTVQMLPAM